MTILKCRYCPREYLLNNHNGSTKAHCNNPECADKHHQEELKRNRRATARRMASIRAERKAVTA